MTLTDLPHDGLDDALVRRLCCGVEPEHRVFWDFQSRRHYLTNQAGSDPRMLRQMVELLGIDSALLVPMLSESEVLGVIAAFNKPGGFDDSDGQLLSILAGPAATFLKAGRVAAAQLRHAANVGNNGRDRPAHCLNHGPRKAFPLERGHNKQVGCGHYGHCVASGPGKEGPGGDISP